MATYENKTGNLVGQIVTGDILNYTYTGTNPSVILPKGNYKLECWGGQGGYYTGYPNYFGKGGQAIGTLVINTNSTLFLCVGGAGNNGGREETISGGYNGGGNGFAYGAGGGATHIALVEGVLSVLESQKDQVIIVAGGGGGGGDSIASGAGGGETGGGVTYGSAVAGGGTQSSGGTSTSGSAYYGSFGQGGTYTRSGMYTCGGGGGYYGGGKIGQGGGGGSGHVNPTYLTDTSMSNGVNSGNGRITITYLGKYPDNMTGDLTDVPFEIGDALKYTYTQTNPWIKLPSGTWKMECWGGAGGGGTTAGSSTVHAGGNGGYAVGTHYIKSESTLFLAVGQMGITGTSSTSSSLGGYNGGGNAYGIYGSGGGATHIAFVEGTLSTLSSLQDQIIIVAGGGGGASSYGGGDGGGETGSRKEGGNQDAGYGGTQVEGGNGGNKGTFGKGGNYPAGSYGGGGGAGWYGGGSGSVACGGGGSGYTSSTYLASASMTNGQNTGDGYIIITYISDKATSLPDNTTGDLTDISFALGATLKYTYTGTNPWIKLPKGSWQIECWGAKGGDSSLKSTGPQYSGGNGGYSVGTYFSNKEQLYICIGAAGTRQTDVKAYNGGGVGAVGPINTAAGGGGGATHVALASGLLKDLVSQKSDIIIVAGGGGGGGGRSTTNGGNGGSGGGEIGGDGAYAGNVGGDVVVGQGGTQTASGQVKVAGGFGYGGDGYQISQDSGAGGGGGGWYGGAGAGWYCGGGGGSGHINETYLSGFSMANGANAGNGYIIFTYIAEGAVYTNKTGDLTQVVHSGDVLNYTYTGTNPSITLPKGEYLLEVWGAKGANNDRSPVVLGGAGGYAVGNFATTSDIELFIACGEKPVDGTHAPQAAYNGGGKGFLNTSIGFATGSGGGATHIALVEGVLKDLESNKDKVIIVAGGGGGASNDSSVTYTGGTGGGETGGAGGGGSAGGAGGTQTSGYAFGLGENYNATYGRSGGAGGGWYGGRAGTQGGSGGGSGYVSTTYLTEASMQNGVNSDAGRITITVLRLVPPPVQIKINGIWTPIDTIKIKINGEWK